MLGWLALLLPAFVIIFLIRSKAVFCALGVLIVLGGGFFIWQQQQEKERGNIDLQVNYDTLKCPSAKPVRVTITNYSEKTLEHLLFTLWPVIPGESPENPPLSCEQNKASKALRQGESYSLCYQEPQLPSSFVPSVRADEVQWTARVDGFYFRNAP